MIATEKTYADVDFAKLALAIKAWGLDLGFQQIGITDTELGKAEQDLAEWLKRGYHGEMAYMAQHGSKRTRPAELLPGTLRIISARMNYLPPNSEITASLNHPTRGYISQYALGRDYHKVLRKRLQQLAKKIGEVVGEFGYRAFCDSAPVMEKPLAAKAGLGWQGKNTLLLNRQAGSWFFLGVLYTDLPLPIDQPVKDHCGTCTACLDICPTQAFVAPYQLDARRCISYLTIEYKGSIPLELRPLIGNRIFGCDDCQLVCPWNKFAQITAEADFRPRQQLTAAKMTDLFAWTENQFSVNTEGSAIRRASYEGWLRNIAIALGNAPTSAEVIAALQTRLHHPSALVREHVVWALQRHIS